MKVILVLALCLGVGVIVFLLWPSNRIRQDVEHWVHGWSWSSDEVPLRVNLQRQQGAIAAFPSEAVKALTEDLHTVPGLPERLERFIAQLRSGGGWFPRAEFRRKQAARALGFMGSKAKAAIPELLHITTNDVGIAQTAAIAALGDIGFADRATIQTLQTLTNLANAASGFAAIALWQLQPTNTSYLDFANAWLAGSNRTAASLLIQMPERVLVLGTNAEALMPGLRCALTNTANGYLRTYAAKSIWYIAADPRPSLEILKPLTNSAPVRNPQAHELCSIVLSLYEIPELCTVIKPWLETMDVSGDEQLPQLRKGALRVIEIGMEQSRTNTARSR